MSVAEPVAVQAVTSLKPVLPDQERARRLEKAARVLIANRRDDSQPWLLPPQARDALHPALTVPLDAWALYCGALERLIGFHSGLLDWRDIAPDLEAADPDAVVAEDLDTDVRDALSTLLNGR